MKKKTAREERNKLIAELLKDHDEKLQELIVKTGKKHSNGGLLETSKQYQQTQLCIKALIEEKE